MPLILLTASFQNHLRLSVDKKIEFWNIKSPGPTRPVPLVTNSVLAATNECYLVANNFINYNEEYMCYDAMLIL